MNYYACCDRSLVIRVTNLDNHSLQKKLCQLLVECIHTSIRFSPAFPENAKLLRLYSYWIITFRTLHSTAIGHTCFSRTYVYRIVIIAPTSSLDFSLKFQIFLYIHTRTCISTLTINATYIPEQIGGNEIKAGQLFQMHAIQKSYTYWNRLLNFFIYFIRPLLYIFFLPTDFPHKRHNACLLCTTCNEKAHYFCQ